LVELAVKVIVVPTSWGDALSGTTLAVWQASVYVNWSADDVALVPPGVVTVTSTTPAAWAGLVALMVVSEMKAQAADVPPKRTAVTPVKPQPLITNVVPPAVGPNVFEMPVTTGAAT
jgi:hypothetical protein